MENKRTRGNFNVMYRLVGWYALSPRSWSAPFCWA